MRGTPLIIDLLDSHKGWKKKFIKLRALEGFGVRLDWQVANGVPNKVFEVTKAEQKIFNQIRIQQFLRNLVKDQQEVMELWPHPLGTFS